MLTVEDTDLVLFVFKTQILDNVQSLLRCMMSSWWWQVVYRIKGGEQSVPVRL